ncbi:MAG: ECF transporter S component, partial [Firmicutes bacterium]|nr:ECF transporter S component [Bacillota bacterium]
MNRKKMSTRVMVTVAMLTAASYILEATIHFPIFPSVPYIQYSPSEIPIAIAAIVFGPFAALVSALAVSLLAMITVGTTGIIGAFINFLAKASFAVTIALIVKSEKVNRKFIIILVLIMVGFILWMTYPLLYHFGVIG